jgi:coenzyme F420-reducing hydrogenase alpha subunit
MNLQWIQQVKINVSVMNRLTINMHMHNWKYTVNTTECVVRCFRACIKCTLLVHFLYASSSSEWYECS